MFDLHQYDRLSWFNSRWHFYSIAYQCFRKPNSSGIFRKYPQHARRHDLHIRFTNIPISPTGTQTSLIRYSNYCNNEDDWNHGLEDGGLNLSGLPCPPIDGLIYNPENPFSSFNNELVDGDWTLIVYDYFNGDAATLTEWTMELCTFDPLRWWIYHKPELLGCDSYVYNGTTYTSSTTVTENLTTASGCDSTINTTITINPSATTNQSFAGCDRYVYNGTTYTSSTTVTENLTTATGCDC